MHTRLYTHTHKQSHVPGCCTLYRRLNIAGGRRRGTYYTTKLKHGSGGKQQGRGRTLAVQHRHTQPDTTLGDLTQLNLTTLPATPSVRPQPSHVEGEREPLAGATPQGDLLITRIILQGTRGGTYQELHRLATPGLSLQPPEGVVSRPQGCRGSGME